jgi:hypothetical protein
MTMPETRKREMSKYQEFDVLPVGVSHEVFVEGRKVSESPYKWSGKEAPPAIGAEVKVTMNGLGPGVVKGYFAEESWLGVLVELKSPPDWWLKQNAAALAKGEKRLAHIFGMEVKYDA